MNSIPRALCALTFLVGVGCSADADRKSPRSAFDDDVGLDRHAVLQSHVRADNRKWSDRDIVSKCRTIVDDRGWMDFVHSVS